MLNSRTLYNYNLLIELVDGGYVDNCQMYAEVPLNIVPYWQSDLDPIIESRIKTTRNLSETETIKVLEVDFNEIPYFFETP